MLVFSGWLLWAASSLQVVFQLAAEIHKIAFLHTAY